MILFFGQSHLLGYKPDKANDEVAELLVFRNIGDCFVSYVSLYIAFWGFWMEGDVHGISIHGQLI